MLLYGRLPTLADVYIHYRETCASFLFLFARKLNVAWKRRFVCPRGQAKDSPYSGAASSARLDRGGELHSWLRTSTHAPAESLCDSTRIARLTIPCESNFIWDDRALFWNLAASGGGRRLHCHNSVSTNEKMRNVRECTYSRYRSNTRLVCTS